LLDHSLAAIQSLLAQLEEADGSQPAVELYHSAICFASTLKPALMLFSGKAR